MRCFSRFYWHVREWPVASAEHCITTQSTLSAALALRLQSGVDSCCSSKPGAFLKRRAGANGSANCPIVDTNRLADYPS